jgi:hypothetical protein
MDDRLTQLKAAAYDCITSIEYFQNRLQQINAAITEEVQAQQAATEEPQAEAEDAA